VTMTVNNKAVKGCGGLPLLFTELPSVGILGNSYTDGRILIQ
jgi:hypothetical protein